MMWHALLQNRILRRRARQAVLILLSLACTLLLTACGSLKTDADQSPVLVDAAISSWSDETEESQYVELELIFDREVRVDAGAGDCFRITISGSRMRQFTLEPGDADNVVRLQIPTTAVTRGELAVERSETADVLSAVTDAQGRYAALDFTLTALIPSGVTLSTVQSAPGRVVKQVDSWWSIRSIAWVGLTENGVLVPVSASSPLEEMDGYAAVHGHEFLREDETDIAAKIAQTLSENLPDDYVFSSDGAQITAEKPGSEDLLDIVLYGYLTIDGVPVEP